ncbi:MAG: pantetheine-phosphate adenylyltransferase [Verrucomicrobiae bacterium]|nr:pantetheine-phosphate adenylyltransferase [Verrucomicrobiae bacterium]
MKTIAIYPGSFDPMTNGHIDILLRAAALFDKVIIALAHHTEKNALFTIQERAELIRQCIQDIPNVEVDDFDTLLVDYVRAKHARVVVRGLRAVSDFEFEFQMALMNRTLAPEVETIFLMPKDSYSYLSSRITKGIAALGGDISQFVPPHIEKALRTKLANAPHQPFLENQS